MFGVASSTASLLSAFTQVGSIIAAALAGILTGVAAMLGLGFGVKKLRDTIFNMPGGYNYNPQYGSGFSRFRKTNYNAEPGHTKMITF